MFVSRLNPCLNVVGEKFECVVNEDKINLRFGDAKYCVVPPYRST